MSLLFFLFVSLSFIAGNGFIHKSKLLLRAVNLMSVSMSSTGMESKAEMIKLCGDIIVGEPVSESLAYSIKQNFEKLEALSTHQNILDNISLLDGEWLLLYSTLPRVFRRISLSDLSANTLKSAEPLIVVSSSALIVSQKTPGVYHYDSHVIFQGGKVDVTSIAGKYTTRAYAKHNIPDSTDSTLRLEVEFSANEARAVSPTKADRDTFNTLFGYSVEDTIMAAFPPTFKAWSDIVYLDDNLLLLRGRNGNLYVQSRVA